MVIEVNKAIKNLFGEPMLDNDGRGNAVELTLKAVMVNSILHPVDKELGMEKVKKYNLAMRIYNSDSVDLTAEEITLIKDRVGVLMPPLVVGQVYEMLGA